MKYVTATFSTAQSAPMPNALPLETGTLIKISDASNTASVTGGKLTFGGAAAKYTFRHKRYNKITFDEPFALYFKATHTSGIWRIGVGSSSSAGDNLAFGFRFNGTTSMQLNLYETLYSSNFPAYMTTTTQESEYIVVYDGYTARFLVKTQGQSDNQWYQVYAEDYVGSFSAFAFLYIDSTTGVFNISDVQFAKSMDVPSYNYYPSFRYVFSGNTNMAMRVYVTTPQEITIKHGVGTSYVLQTGNQLIQGVTNANWSGYNVAPATNVTGLTSFTVDYSRNYHGVYQLVPSESTDKIVTIVVEDGTFLGIANLASTIARMSLDSLTGRQYDAVKIAFGNGVFRGINPACLPYVKNIEIFDSLPLVAKTIPISAMNQFESLIYWTGTSATDYFVGDISDLELPTTLKSLSMFGASTTVYGEGSHLVNDNLSYLDYGNTAGTLTMDLSKLPDEMPLCTDFYLNINASTIGSPFVGTTEQVPAFTYDDVLQGGYFGIGGSGITGNLSDLRNINPFDYVYINYAPNIVMDTMPSNYDQWGKGRNSYREFAFQNNSMSQAEVDNIINWAYSVRANFTGSGLTNGNIYMYIGGTNAAPTGTYQSSATPSTGKEKIYALVNDPNGEGFVRWNITYTA